MSFVTAFILPKLLGVSANGYYQLYLLFTNYVGILHLGFNDGVYLKFGGVDYDDLPRGVFRAFMRFYFAFNALEVLIFTALLFFETDPNRRFAIFFAILNILVVNAAGLFNKINQISNRIKIFSGVVIAGNVQTLAGVGVLVLVHGINFRTVILCDFAAKLMMLLINLFFDRDIVFGRSEPLKGAFDQCVDNFRVGIKLTIANLMGMLVLNLGNFILSFGSIANFSLYSFAINSTNIAMMFISAISLVLYPILCRLDREALPRYFLLMNRLLCAAIFCMMLLYYPLELAIKLWLKAYTPVLAYLYLLFPIVIMQSKILMLINTYYNSLREEKAMLIANVSSIIVFICITLPLFALIPSINVIAWTTLITFTWRCYASEIYLKKKMGLRGVRNMIEELLMAAAFIVTAGVIGGVAGMVIYALLAALYLFINRTEIKLYSKKFIAAVRS
jgi:O-antigen/teichoic acid export membrane protein